MTLTPLLRLLAGGGLILLAAAAGRALAPLSGGTVPWPALAMLLLLAAMLPSPRLLALLTPAAERLVALLGALLVAPLVPVFFLPLAGAELAKVAALLVVTTLLTGGVTALLAKRWLR